MKSIPLYQPSEIDTVVAKMLRAHWAILDLVPDKAKVVLFGVAVDFTIPAGAMPWTDEVLDSLIALAEPTLRHGTTEPISPLRARCPLCRHWPEDLAVRDDGFALPHELRAHLTASAGAGGCVAMEAAVGIGNDIVRRKMRDHRLAMNKRSGDAADGSKAG